MRSALAKLDGIEESDIEIDYAAKTASVSVAETKLTAADLAAALEGTKFSATAH